MTSFTEKMGMTFWSVELGLTPFTVERGTIFSTVTTSRAEQLPMECRSTRTTMLQTSSMGAMVTMSSSVRAEMTFCSGETATIFYMVGVAPTI